MAIVGLALWMFTVAVGVYLLASSTRVSATVSEEEPEPVTVPAAVPAAREKDRFDPLSLREAKSEPVPGLRALGEFAHPALGVIGFGFWMMYTFVHDKIFAAIGLGVLLGTVAAGLTWAAANSRAVKKDKDDALIFRGKVLLFHVAGAALTLILGAVLVLK